MESFQTEQEKFWAGQFGNEYIYRNVDKKIIAGNIALFSKILKHTKDIESIIEFGSNIGLNLIALKQLMPNIKVAGVEINTDAVALLKQNIPDAEVFHQSIFDYQPTEKKDLVFTKGVLIHINPDYLNKVYEKMYFTSNKYILVAEYYNPSPVEINYRGNKGFLFKRDFAGEIMDKYPDVQLIDYGFVYHKDPNFPLDDITWFLLKKN